MAEHGTRITPRLLCFVDGEHPQNKRAKPRVQFSAEKTDKGPDRKVEAKYTRLNICYTTVFVANISQNTTNKIKA